EAKAVWYGSSTGGFAVAERSVGAGLEPVGGDFDGDGTGDVLWWSAGGGAGELWLGRRGAAPDVRPQPASGPGEPVAFDGDGDGDDDLVWYDTATGAVSLWRSLG